VRVVKTPGGKNVVQYTKKRAAGPMSYEGGCVCGVRLPGVRLPDLPLRCRSEGSQGSPETG
jgi:ribosomal protein L34E